MSVSLSVHRVASVQIERHEHEDHCWTKLRMLGPNGDEIFVVDVFSAYLGHVEIVDIRPAFTGEEIEISDASIP